jgi:hypothetical protein
MIMGEGKEGTGAGLYSRPFVLALSVELMTRISRRSASWCTAHGTPRIAEAGSAPRHFVG